jgi:Na+-driven multidrug efflux pump
MVIQGGFRGAGQTRVAFVLSLLSRWIFRIPLAFLLAYAVALDPVAFTPVDVNGLWWGMSASAVASFVVGVVWFHRGDWRTSVIDDGPSDGAGEAVADDVGDDVPADDPVTD